MIYVPWFVLSSGQAQLELSHPNVRGVALHLHQWKIDVVPRLVWRPEQRTSFCIHFVRTIVGGWIVMHVWTLAMKQLYGASKSWFRSYLPLLNGDGRVMDYITNHQGKISPHVALVYCWWWWGLILFSGHAPPTILDHDAMVWGMMYDDDSLLLRFPTPNWNSPCNNPRESRLPPRFKDIELSP